MKRSLLAAALIAAAMTTALAQDKPAPAPGALLPQAPPKTLTPLKVQFVVSRFQGEKKISSLPYTLSVLAGGRQTSMRMGISVPVVQTVFGSSNKSETSASTPMSSYSYKNVGTNIDCTATDTGGGQYSLLITLEDSSIHDTPDRSARLARDVPVFRSFNSTFSVLVRDGQTMQYASVTDPLSGEVIKVDVTVNVVK